MIESDTIKLLRECDAGVRMGTSSIDDVLSYAKADALRADLAECKREHNVLQQEIQTQLDRFQDQGKAPSPMAQRMSQMMTKAKLSMGGTDQTIADLMTDGCNMGVKSLNRYLNQYKAADEYSKDIAKRLIHLEEKLTEDMRPFL